MSSHFLLECFSNAIITQKTNGRKANDFEASTDHWLSKVPRHLFKSITFDYGKKFSNWKSISNAHDIDISLWVQDVLVKEVSMNILIAYGDGITETKGV